MNSILASCDFCCLLITFANRLDPDQDQQNVISDLDLYHLTLWYFFEEKVNFENQQMTKACKDLRIIFF